MAAAVADVAGLCSSDRPGVKVLSSLVMGQTYHESPNRGGGLHFAPSRGGYARPHIAADHWSASTPVSTDPYRLPRTVIPARYELTLEPDLTAATFAGECSTEVEVIERTDEIVCNAFELEIDEAWVEQQGPDGRRVAVDVRLDPETERAHLLLAEPVEPGGWFVVTRFRGLLNDRLVGFYRSTFAGDDGDTHVIATSQMEATYARQAFPCWDEPELKAVFAVTLVVPDGTLALSNAGEIGRTPLDDGRVSVQFADTMVMSSYLVAFVVGPLEATPPTDVDNVPLRIVHRPGQGHLTDFALEVGASRSATSRTTTGSSTRAASST